MGRLLTSREERTGAGRARALRGCSRPALRGRLVVSERARLRRGAGWMRAEGDDQVFSRGGCRLSGLIEAPDWCYECCAKVEYLYHQLGSL